MIKIRYFVLLTFKDHCVTFFMMVIARVIAASIVFPVKKDDYRPHT